jgi:hypothetical protein
MRIMKAVDPFHEECNLCRFDIIMGGRHRAVTVEAVANGTRATLKAQGITCETASIVLTLKCHLFHLSIDTHFDVSARDKVKIRDGRRVAHVSARKEGVAVLGHYSSFSAHRVSFLSTPRKRISAAASP